DMLLTAGERIAMAVLSMAIRELGGDAISFTGSQSGIITNDRHVDARIIEVRPFRVQDELARGKIVVIAGYQGVSYRREVTTRARRHRRFQVEIRLLTAPWYAASRRGCPAWSSASRARRTYWCSLSARLKGSRSR